jgi:hypothetical protein
VLPWTRLGTLSCVLLSKPTLKVVDVVSDQLVAWSQMPLLRPRYVQPDSWAYTYHHIPVRLTCICSRDKSEDQCASREDRWFVPIRSRQLRTRCRIPLTTSRPCPWR